MNEDFQNEIHHHQNNAKLIDRFHSLNYIDHQSSRNNTNFNNYPINEKFIPFEQGIEIIQKENAEAEVSSSESANDCLKNESEVKSLKEWLILHNDLIQQQNDEILKKEQQIYHLQKENEMLRDRLLCLEKEIPYSAVQQQQVVKDTGLENRIIIKDNIMTQDSCGQYEDDSKENIEFVDHPIEDAVTCSLEAVHHQQTRQINNNKEAESQVDTTINEDNLPVEDSDFKSEDYLVNNDLSDSFKTESDPAECSKDTFSEYNFTVNNFCELDSMKNIKMSIRRKRISTSSIVSNNEPTTATGERKTLRKPKRKKRIIGKDRQILTSKEPYLVYHPSDDPLSETESPELFGNHLEVPRWRMKLYNSCYTMEGTENLDDEVFNKRHMRLEIDERRRKRWDVQRIREQRVIEKLKQRQERIGNGSKGENDHEIVTSLWPKVDELKFLDVIDELPVSAFGHAVPRVVKDNFSLPWLNIPTISTRRNASKRVSISTRKRSRNRR